MEKTATNSAHRTRLKTKRDRVEVDDADVKHADRQERGAKSAKVAKQLDVDVELDTLRRRLQEAELFAST